MSSIEAYSSTIVIGLNPALQKRFILSDKTPQLVPGNVHRASGVQQGIGGKGQDVFVALSCLQSNGNKNEARQKPLTYLAQFVGNGAEGDITLELLDKLLEVEKEPKRLLSPSLETLTIRCNAKLRTCTTIIAQDTATELVEPSGDISEDEIQHLKQKMYDLVNKKADTKVNAPKALCIMGSMPPGCPNTLYGHLYDIVAAASATPKESGLLCVVDSVVGLDHLFERMKYHREQQTDATPKNMLKVNLAELQRLANMPSDSSSVEASDASIKDIELVLENFLSTPNVKDALDYIAITNGCHSAFLTSLCGHDMHITRLTVPDLTLLGGKENKKLYPIGAGDAVTAGSLAAWNFYRGTDMNGGNSNLLERIQRALSSNQFTSITNDVNNHVIASFAFGIACGSASCLKEENSMLSEDDVIRLFSEIKIES